MNPWKPWTEDYPKESELILVGKRGQHPLIVWRGNEGEWTAGKGVFSYVPEYYMPIPSFPDKTKCYLVLGKAQIESNYSIWSQCLDKEDAKRNLGCLKNNNPDCQFKLHEIEWEE